MVWHLYFALHSIFCVAWYNICILHCIVFKYTINIYCVAWYEICIAWLLTCYHHLCWCLHQELSTSRTDNADKCFLHFTTLRNTCRPTILRLLHFSTSLPENRKLINGWIGGGAAALTISAEKFWRSRLKSGKIDAFLLIPSLTLHTLSMVLFHWLHWTFFTLLSLQSMIFSITLNFSLLFDLFHCEDVFLIFALGSVSRNTLPRAIFAYMQKLVPRGMYKYTPPGTMLYFGK